MYINILAYLEYIYDINTSKLYTFCICWYGVFTFTNTLLPISDDNYTYDSEDKTVIFLGSSSPSECLNIISIFLQKSHSTCYPKPCAIGSIYQPSIGSDIFYATVGFAFTAADLNATDSLGRLDINKLNKTAHIYCSKVSLLKNPCALWFLFWCRVQDSYSKIRRDHAWYKDIDRYHYFADYRVCNISV